MAHPRLATAARRSLLTATTAALMVGPLAGAGFAQVDPLLDLTCEEAKATENDELRALYVDEFCTDEQAEATESPLDKSVDEVTGTVEKTLSDGGETVAPDQEAGGGGGGGGGGGTTEPGEVLNPPTNDSPTNTDVGTTGGNDGFRGVKENPSPDGGSPRGVTTAGGPAVGYNSDGPILPGMRSNSSLTLQPFAAPLVSVPPVYDLPQIASSLFGADTAATAEDPLVAGAATGTGASAYSPTGFSATTADPTGWLAATATGLIMLVGAAHAINGGRTPKRRSA